MSSAAESEDAAVVAEAAAGEVCGWVAGTLGSDGARSEVWMTG